jgi:hypothetical protein
MKNLYLTMAFAVVMTASFVSNLVNELVAVAIARSERQAASFKLDALIDRDPQGHLPSLCTIGGECEGLR